MIKPVLFALLLALTGASAAQGACPAPTDLRWSPVPTVAGDDLVLEMVQWNAGYLTDGTMEILPDRQVLIRTISTSNFGVNPPISSGARPSRTLQKGAGRSPGRTPGSPADRRPIRARALLP